MIVNSALFDSHWHAEGIYYNWKKNLSYDWEKIEKLALSTVETRSYGSRGRTTTTTIPTTSGGTKEGSVHSIDVGKMDHGETTNWNIQRRA